jgi:hypothetical protein
LDRNSNRIWINNASTKLLWTLDGQKYSIHLGLNGRRIWTNNAQTKLFWTLEGQKYPHLFGPKPENMDKQRPNNFTLNPWQSDIPHLFVLNQKCQRPSNMILNPWRSENPHLFCPQPRIWTNNAQITLFWTLDGQTFPIYFVLNREYGQTTPKQHDFEPLTVRKPPSILSSTKNMDKQRPNNIILNPWRSEIPHLFCPEPRIWTNNAQTTLFWTLDGQKCPIYFVLNRDDGQTMPKQHYFEPLMVSQEYGQTTPKKIF